MLVQGELLTELEATMEILQPLSQTGVRVEDTKGFLLDRVWHRIRRHKHIVGRQIAAVCTVPAMVTLTRPLPVQMDFLNPTGGRNGQVET